MFTEYLCEHIRKLNPEIEIVLGGQGVLTYGIGKNTKNYGDIMKDKGLCDIYIAGEGEVRIVDVLNKDLDIPGINNENFTQVNELDNMPFPNYSFYYMDEYDYLQEEKEVYIVGSLSLIHI